MHNNFYVLQKVSDELNSFIKGGVISECFSQNKEELIVRIELGKQSFYIKSNLQPVFSCLSFPEVFHRAKKNSVDLFADCIGLQVQGVRQFKNERSFALLLSENYQLVFKMHGNRSNVILFHQEKFHLLFRNNLQADETLDYNALDKEIIFNEATFQLHKHKLKQYYFTLGKVVWTTLEDKGFFKLSTAEQWLELQAVQKQLQQPTFYITRWKNNIVLSLLPVGEIIKTETAAIKALNIFTQEYLQSEGFYREKQNLLQQLAQSIKSTQNYIAKAKAKILEVSGDEHYKIWADVLMANLHKIPNGVDKIVLQDFYHNNDAIEIKLKRELSAQKNAEVFYRKVKNKQLEITRLESALTEKEIALTKLENQLASVQQIESLKALRQFDNQNFDKQSNNGKQEPLPYHAFEFKGFKILVGRNAQANDLLTLKFAYKEDLWLHAKDVAGSHVIIKHQSGKPFPKDVLEKAAQLAAYNSKRKSESLVPVAYTPKKFVRKRKGDPAGMVVVEREEVLLVEPKLKTDIG